MHKSSSTRRTWIEMSAKMEGRETQKVVLHTEDVD